MELRSKNSIRNVSVTVICQIINILLSFLCRTIFIQILSETYLGLSGLFSDVLYVLSVAELGISTAITFSMYKPLAQNNLKEIGALMAFYRKTYHTIGIVVAVIGLSLTPLNMYFPLITVLILVLNFYTTGMRQTTLMFKNALGLFWYDRYKAVVEAVVNLIASLILAHFFGVPGIFLGTLISTMTVDFWVEPLVLFRHGFHQRVRTYFKQYIGYAIVTSVSGLLTYYLCSCVRGNYLIGFIGKCFVCVIVPNLLYFIIFHHSNEFQYLKSTILISLKPK